MQWGYRKVPLKENRTEYLAHFTPLLQYRPTKWRNTIQYVTKSFVYFLFLTQQRPPKTVSYSLLPALLEFSNSLHITQSASIPNTYLHKINTYIPNIYLQNTIYIQNTYESDTALESVLGNFFPFLFF